MQITFDRPQKDDTKEIESLFRKVIVDTFEKNAIPEAYVGEISDLVRKNSANVKQDIASNGSQEYFLIARNKKHIVGIMGFGKPNKEIRKNYKGTIDTLPEIKNAFILPEFQRKGIGTQLFQKLKELLKQKGFTEFLLDSGFASAQVYWKKKLGSPAVEVKNYWGDGTDYLIWHTKL